MHRALPAAFAAVIMAASLTAIASQQTVQIHPGKGGSPHVRSSWLIDRSAISIEYGRPSLKGRDEATVMPPGQPWRIGADEATTITSGRPLQFGSLTVPSGSHTLYAIPGPNAWTLIVSKKTGQWGVPYPGEAEDLGRVPMTVTRTQPVEQLTISIEDTAAGAILHIDWGTTRASAPFTVVY